MQPCHTRKSGALDFPHQAGHDPRIFQQLVEKLNIDAFIEACRTGKSGKTAECATDGAVPGIKKDAEKESKEQFQEDDGKKQDKGKAMPIGETGGH